MNRVLVINNDFSPTDEELENALKKIGYEIIQVPAGPVGRDILLGMKLCPEHDFTMIIYNGQGLQVGSLVDDFRP